MRCVLSLTAKITREKYLLKQLKKYPNLDVKYETQEWGGAPKARNRACEMGDGEYVTYLDPDVYLYSQTLRQWANAFESNPDKDVVWGFYDIYISEERKEAVGGRVPLNNDGEPEYYAFRSSNYMSGANPIRRKAIIGWDETVKSLQDWDMWMRMLLKDNFKGDKFFFIAQSFFATEPPKEGGLSNDSSKNWKERVKYIREKNGIPAPDTVISSLGAPFHAINTAKLLGADYLPMPSFKPNDYKTVYLLGFYTAENPESPGVTRDHMQVFTNHKGRKIIHWIGTDVSQMHWKNSFQKLKAITNWFKSNKIIHLTEAKHTHREMKELGVESKIVPLPPATLYEPMPLPKKFTISVYDNPTQDMYKVELMKEVALSMPDIDFKFFGNPKTKGNIEGNVEHLGWVDMGELIKETSCNLRVTIHDGLPLIPLQYLTAGRQVVCSTDLYGVIKTGSERKEIIESIRKAQESTLPEKVSKHWIKELNTEKFKKTIKNL